MKIVKIKHELGDFYAESDLKPTFACSADPVFFVTEIRNDDEEPYCGYVEPESIVYLDALQIDNVRRWQRGGLIGE